MLSALIDRFVSWRRVPARWGMVAAYAAVAAANQLLWLTYVPITTDAAAYFGVSESAVGWLSQVFPLLYVLLALPAGLALDRWFGPSLLAGAWLTALGGAVRLTGDTFAVALAGQVLVAIAQPLILNAVTKVAVSRCPNARGRAGSRSARRASSPAPPWRCRSARHSPTPSRCFRCCSSTWRSHRRRPLADRRVAAKCRVARPQLETHHSPAPDTTPWRRRPPSPAAPNSAPSGATARSGAYDVAFLGFGVFVALTT